jgi:hypothetical protein
MVVMLLLFAGLSLDAGLLYVTKARLTAAVDGACLAGMKNLQQGQTAASSVATNIFNATFGSNPPTPTITFPTDSSGNQQVKVTATKSVRTLFMRLSPGFATIPVSATAVSTRGKLIMTIVLDRSGSMCGGTVPCKHGETGTDQGGQALQAAVPVFVNNFDDTANTGDEVGLVSFSSNATIDYAVNYGFKNTNNGINKQVAAMSFEGATFGTGIGTGTLLSNTIGPPLKLAGNQNDGITIQSGQNVIKAVVYFTDGLMNTVQDNFHCNGRGNNTLSLINYGGYDNPTSATYAAILDPTQAYNIYGVATSSGFPYTTSGTTCKDSNNNNVTTFVSQQPGKGNLDFHQSNVTGEAKYRAKITATSLRSESPHPNFIYTIGLGSAISGDSNTQMFLKEVANDPSADTYDPTQATGQFFLIKDCPSTPASICNNEVLQVFQTIAAKVLLRLTQ